MRTPVFRLIRRSLRVAQASLHDRRPLPEMLDEERELGISRRRFIAASATVAAGAALQGCVPVQRIASGSTEPVLIVGAGIAGLTTGYRLQQAGVPVRIIDAQNRVGGRMFSLRDFFPDGQVAELGGELIDTNHSAIRGLAGEMGIELNDLAVEDPTLRTEVWYFGGQARSDRDVIEAFRPIAARIEEDLETLEGDGDVTVAAPNNGQRLDTMTLAQWLDEAGVSGWIRSLLDVGYTTEFGLEPEEQSALNLLTMIDTNPDPFHIFGESDERFHVRGGNDLIIKALASRLDGAIETTSRLEAVTARPDGSIACSVRRGRSSIVITAPKVLLALPFTLLREVRIDVPMSAEKKRTIDELGYGTNAKLMVGFSDRVWRNQHSSNGSVLTDLPFQLCWETSRAQNGRSGILTNFTGGNHGLAIGSGTDREQAARFTAELERVFSGVLAAREGMKEVRFHWPTNPFVKGSYACYKPGQWTSMRGLEGERAGNLHFAGE
ncbi:MAG TPA: NAD(P)/FAD-dependent oxidoreductase, partial [Thermoanaerobaculia bacterium]|nr:NAD(P)/FAD-dependent oxidoreductase [Thermoanaerobaculia bacterium]